jgi:hypothetical protein
VDLGSGGWCAELGVGGGDGQEKRGGQGQGEDGAVEANGDRFGLAMEHGFWTAPLRIL